MADRVGQQLGHYRLLRLLGQGSFAEVYLGEHLYLERPAAIKVLHVRMEPKAQEKFRREARTIAHLQHPHIVQVLDFGLDDQTPYLVMEYSPGGTLRKRHPKGTRLAFEQIVSYVKQIASALDYAHQQHVIHRDIKPDNLLLNTRDEVVLSDFGLAVVQHTLDSLSTQNTAGTPLYMAPEQIQRKPCAASDQYALGVIVYEWLTGDPPFRGSLYEVFSQHLSEPPPSLCAQVPQLPRAVEDAVFGALAKDPRQRFVSVQDFATVLEQLFESTQLLSLHQSTQRQKQGQEDSPVTLSASILASSNRATDHSADATQPRPMVTQRKGDEHGSARVVTPLSVVASPTVSKQARPSVAQSNRQRFLRRVRAFWIDGVLSHSLHGAALIALGLQEQLDALANPWHLVLHHPDTAPRSFPVGTRITQVYDQANGELLILGAPGSGKTTLLLELARDLLDRAEQDEQCLMPVVFTLSSWAAKQQRLAEWMVEELIDKYQVPRKLARMWVDTDQILPLLDGLDEVAPESRTACIEAINAYHQEHGLLPLVVASRSADYLAQTGRVMLNSAVTVQPLTPQQVDDYLASGGESLWALQVALQQNVTLRELTNTPLMLSILTLTYHGVPVEDLLREASITDRQRQIFERYVERMLRYRGAEIRYTQEQTMHGLSWLARQMKQQSQTVFYLEHMQPTWLSGERMPQNYDQWAVRFPVILMGMLLSITISSLLYTLDFFLLARNIILGGFVAWLLADGRTTLQQHEISARAKGVTWPRLIEWLRVGGLIGLGYGLCVSLRFWLLYSVGPSFGLVVGVISGLSVGLGSILLQVLLEKSNTPVPSLQARQSSRKPEWQHLMQHAGIRNGLLAGLLLGLSATLGAVVTKWLTTGQLISGLSTGLNLGLVIVGLTIGLTGGLLSMLLSGMSRDISLTDELVWSWRSLRRSLLAKKHINITLRITAFVALLYGLLDQLLVLLNGPSPGMSNGLVDGLVAGLSIGLSFWLLFGLFQGVSSETIGDQHRAIPNQGIRRSARNSLLLGLISIGIVLPSAGLIIGLSDVIDLSQFAAGLSFGLPEILLAGLSVGLLAGLFMGGLAWWRHWVLRFLLWRAGSMPWNYPRFLDFAAERILLSKVGGGYIFVHRLLLEYFASLDTTSMPDAARARQQQAQPVS